MLILLFVCFSQRHLRICKTWADRVALINAMGIESVWQIPTWTGTYTWVAGRLGLTCLTWWPPPSNSRVVMTAEIVSRSLSDAHKPDHMLISICLKMVAEDSKILASVHSGVFSKCVFVAKFSWNPLSVFIWGLNASLQLYRVFI